MSKQTYLHRQAPQNNISRASYLAAIFACAHLSFSCQHSLNSLPAEIVKKSPTATTCTVEAKDTNLVLRFDILGVVYKKTLDLTSDFHLIDIKCKGSYSILVSENEVVVTLGEKDASNNRQFLGSTTIVHADGRVTSGFLPHNAVPIAFNIGELGGIKKVTWIENGVVVKTNSDALFSVVVIRNPGAFSIEVSKAE